MLSKSGGDKISHFKKWWGHVPSVPTVNDTYGCTVHSCVCLYHTPERDSVPGSSEDDVTASLRSAPERDAVISRECQDQDQ